MANPAASGFTAALHRSVLAVLRGAFDVTPAWPESAAQARAMAADAAHSGTDVVAAMGGDGIVHRIANGITGTPAALGVIPAGTTNVFARVIGVPDGIRAARLIASRGVARPVPSLQVVGDGPGGTIALVAIFAAGVGFDADVVREAERSPLRKVGAGTVHYARSTLRTIPRYWRRVPNLRVAVDGTRFDAITVMAQAHDRYTFLGRRAITLSPDGGPALLAMQQASPARMLRLVIRAARHRPLDTLSGVAVWHPFTLATIEADPPVALEADGEHYGEVTTLTITARRDALRVIVPA